MTATDFKTLPFKTLEANRRVAVINLIAAAQAAAAAPFDFAKRRTLREKLEATDSVTILRAARDGEIATEFLKNAQALIQSRNSYQANKAAKALKNSSLAYRLTPREDTTHTRAMRQRADVYS